MSALKLQIEPSQRLFLKKRINEMYINNHPEKGITFFVTFVRS